MAGWLLSTLLFSCPLSADEPGKAPRVKQQPSAQQTPKPQPEDPRDAARKPLPPLPPGLQQELRGATALNPEGTVLLDPKKKQVLLRTEVACPDCILEMALVPEGNREHETILRIRAKAFVIHSALLAIGLEPGKPAVFSPEFRPPQGPVVEIQAVWLDASGKRRQRRLQEWVRHNTHRYQAAKLSGPPPGLQLPWKNLRWDRFNSEILWFGPMTDAERDELLRKWKDPDWQKAIRQFHADGQSRPMTAEFVFAGSSMVRDEETGREYYQAEGGHLICTSNFPDAMLDLREESSASDGAQTYEGWTERLPPEGTPVLLLLSAAQEKTEPPKPEK
ncbi:MAG: YdjY domain-containing protein [Planctomycetota bacterium]